MKAIKRLHRRAHIANILHEFRGLKHIAATKTQQRRKLMTHMKDARGDAVTDRCSIADVFADFYADLYASREDVVVQDTPEDAARRDDVVQNIPPFSRRELVGELKGLKKSRCKATAGIVAEMLQNGGGLLVDVLLSLYNAIIDKDGKPPTKWKESVITVLFKSGDPGLAQNYRPITIIPLLYKLFAKLLYKRMSPTLDRAQCSDQAGFRPGYGTHDHLFTWSILCEKADEHQRTIWAAALDFRKAFDSISHAKLWEALQVQGVPCSYINLLRKLYDGQSARVRTDRLSKPFGIFRGTKQGDPLSSSLFNALLEFIMKPLKEKWARKRFGVQLGATAATRITNQRFADDVLLVGCTRYQIQEMLKDVQAAALECGLELHPDKTKVITNATKKSGRGREQQLNINGLSVELLPFSGAVKYLGRKTSFENVIETELNNRLRAGWAKFMSFKQELTGKHYSLHDRLRLFDSVVSPTVLYASCTWTLTRRLENLVTRTQRRMLRMILGAGRRRANTDVAQPAAAQETTYEQAAGERNENDDDDGDDVTSDVVSIASEVDLHFKTVVRETGDLEPWHEWIRRCTRQVETHLEKIGIESWIVQARRQKWRWAGRVANYTADRWPHIVASWDPQLHFDRITQLGRRKQAHPKLRWTDDIEKFTSTVIGHKGHWIEAARENSTWLEFEQAFVEEPWRL